MKTILTSLSILALVSVLLLSSLAAPSVAFADNAPEGCDKVRGTIVCETTENVGNAPEHSNSQETTTTFEKKGSMQSSHEPEEECSGPPGQCK